MTDREEHDAYDEEIDGEHKDDAVIGRAFRRSLVVFGVLLVLVAIVMLVTRPKKEVIEEAEDVVLPEVAGRQITVPPLPFTDITADSGVTFTHFNGAAGDKLLPETMGGGVAFFDYDNDGDQDLLFINGAPWPENATKDAPFSLALFANDGSGAFSDVTATMGLQQRFYGMGVAIGDYDNDGLVDFFVTAVGQNQLFRNTGKGFRNVTALAGVGGGEATWSTGAGFLDYDNDGDLDLFVCNYIKWSREIDFQIDFRLTGVGRAYGPPTNFEGDHAYLYRNDGNGSFTDVSQQAGIQVNNPATGKPMSKALAVMPVDFDSDGDLDLFVANDTVQNFCFENRGDGTFVEAGADVGMAFDRNGNATGAMGMDAAWYRNDAHLGLAIGNFANEMTSLYVVQQGARQFADEAIGEGVGPKSRAALTFGLLFMDVDLDGRQDLIQANGHLEEEINQVQAGQHYRQPAQIFWNTGQGRSFEPVSDYGDFGKPIVGRGVACADIDNDGDEDVVFTQIAGPPLILRNDQSTGHNWVRIRLADSKNTYCIGARLELTAGDTTQIRQIMPTRSYLSQNPQSATFGLGELTEVQSLKIVWPDGEEQVLDGPEINREHLITRGQ